MNFRGICLFANLRTGSTYVCQQLAHAMETVHGQRPAVLYEYLSSAVAYTKDWESQLIDPTHRVPRPFMTALDLDRLRQLPLIMDQGLFPILKIFPEDYTHHNYEHIHRYIINDPKIFKICLNRADIRNQFLSYFIARSTNKFHVYLGDASEDERPCNQMTVTAAEMDEIKNVILMHYSWHATNAQTYCHKTVWYHDMTRVDYPELGLPLESLRYERQRKAVNDHTAMGTRCITNFTELDAYATKLEKHLAGLRRDLGGDQI